MVVEGRGRDAGVAVVAVVVVAVVMLLVWWWELEAPSRGWRGWKLGVVGEWVVSRAVAIIILAVELPEGL